MVGRVSGVATRLRADVPHMVSSNWLKVHNLVNSVAKLEIVDQNR